MGYLDYFGGCIVSSNMVWSAVGVTDVVVMLRVLSTLGSGGFSGLNRCPSGYCSVGWFTRGSLSAIRIGDTA